MMKNMCSIMNKTLIASWPFPCFACALNNPGLAGTFDSINKDGNMCEIWSDENEIIIRLVNTQNTHIVFSTFFQDPIPSAFNAIGLLYDVFNLKKSLKTSKVLKIMDQNAASGNDAANKVIYPNWITTSR